jgi:hypothetical protein
MRNMTKQEIINFALARGWAASYSGKRRKWYFVKATHTPVSETKLRRELREAGAQGVTVKA